MFYETLEYADPQYPVICHHPILDDNSPCVNAHWHENYELLYIQEGEMVCLLDGRKYCAKAGDTVIVNSGVMHYLETSSRCRYICLLADPDWLSKRGLRPTQAHFNEIIHDDQTADLLQTIRREHVAGNACFQMYVLSLVDQLFVFLARNHLQQVNLSLSPQESTLHAAVKKAMRYIHAHSSDAMTLEEISRQAGFAKNYFCRIFAEYTGLSPMRYLNRVRCEDARHMLMNGDCTVSEAAQRCGFPSISHFSQNYRKTIGHAPSKDRKKSAT